ncbi:hypothetical protein SDJN02_12666, partial [Cucurbita argyrosperma subsp. argyrosperma]|uniref:11S globulin subunit beta n=1 Tax=Cucurbita pepo subsp. pepo TaxID=3664 RepID=UPI000C9D86C3
MARSSLFTFLCLAVFINGCLSQIEQQSPWEFQGSEEWQQHRYQSPRACRLENLRAQEPVRRAEAEAGFTEVWDQDNDEFQCAGVNMIRHTIRPKGLLLPGFSNAPKLVFVAQGFGIRGIAIPGCAETYQTDLRRSQSAGSAFRDQHQKIRPFREGDLLVVPAGVSHWMYNRGQSDLVLIVFADTRNVANQIDPYLRKFYLAGRPEQVERGVEEWERSSRKGSSGEKSGNLFSGFADEFLEEAFQIDGGLVRKLKGEDDERDRIVQVDEDFEVLLPEKDEEERSRGRYIESESESENGLEETICTLRLKHNIGRSERADVFNPRGGRISTANYHTLPVLRQVRLSAERGVLYSNAMVAPHYTVNSHSVMYATRGSARVQVVDNFGQSVFDGEVQEGQVLMIPQNFVVIKRASDRGFEWIAFKTNDNAITNLLAGRVSQMRMLPLGVLSNMYRISREEAQRLKYGQQEMRVFSPGRSQGRRE